MRVATQLGPPRHSLWRVLVFPCGSEVAGEIMASLAPARRVQLIGLSSVSDHGEYACRALGIPYLEDVPFVTDPRFISRIGEICSTLSVDFVFPAMDTVAAELSANEDALAGALVLSSPSATTRLCANKRNSYQRLAATGLCPTLYVQKELREEDFPVFAKPAVGYGARGARRIESFGELDTHLSRDVEQDVLLCEYLPGGEYTVDCFTDSQRRLLYCNSRVRDRVRMGISVRTFDAAPELQASHRAVAEVLNQELAFRGPWFFQLKEDRAGKPRLLEVAARLGGSSGLARAQGVNLALLALYDRAGYPVSVEPAPLRAVVDRALNHRVGVLQVSQWPRHLYVDFDDCLQRADGTINSELVALMVEARNRGLPVTVLSRHQGDLADALARAGLTGLIDEVRHLTEPSISKASQMVPDGLLIDDAFAELRQARLEDRLAVGIENLELARALLRGAPTGPSP